MKDDKWVVVWGVDGLLSLVGHPEPFRFNSRKEARKKAQRLDRSLGPGVVDIRVMRESEFETHEQL